MTPAESKTIRESLGVSVEWLAKAIGIKPRSVIAWETGKADVNPAAICMLDHIELRVETYVSEFVGEVENAMREEKPPEKVHLVLYHSNKELWRSFPEMKGFPLPIYTSMMARIRRDLKYLGIDVSIQYAELDDYIKWLNGRPNTESQYMEWTSTLYKS